VVAAAEPDRAVAGTRFVNAILLTLAVLTVVMPIIVYPFLTAL
jgi:hypothetical protein